MAGTGHPYEVINACAARKRLADMGSQVTSKEGQAWFSLPHVLKFATSAHFVVPMNKDNADEQFDKYVESDAEKDFLKGKLKKGCDIRIFVPEFFDTVGPDWGHIIDWQNNLPIHAPRMLRKLPRITVPQAVQLAARWSDLATRNLKISDASGVIGQGLKTVAGRYWVELLDKTALAEESRALRHCVWGYDDKLGKTVRIFSLRDSMQRVLVTGEILLPTSGSDLHSRSYTRYHQQRSKPAAGQFRGYWNCVPSMAYQPDIITLLNHVGAANDEKGEASSVGVFCNEHGRWGGLRQHAKLVEYDGRTCMGVGQDLYLTSPTDPATILAIIKGTKPEWWSATDSTTTTRYVVRCGHDRYSLEEQRAIARCAHGASYSSDAFDFLRVVDGRPVPWVDQVQQKVIGGVTCHVDADVVYLQRPSDVTRTLAAIYNKKHERFSWSNMTACLDKQRITWTPSEIRLLVALCNALDVKVMEESDSLLRRGLYRAEMSKWVYLPDHISKRPSLTSFPDGKSREWHVSPWTAQLKETDKAEVSIETTSDGLLGNFTGFRSDRLLLSEMLEYLNTERIKPGGSWGAPYSKMYGWWTQNERPTTIVWDGFAWRVISSGEELVPILRKSQRSRGIEDKAVCEAICAMLPEAGSSEEVDSLLCRGLAGWAREVIQNDQLYLPAWNSPTSGTYLSFNDTLKRTTPMSRLREAASLRDKMRPAERRLITKLVTSLLRKAVGRTRRPKGDAWWSNRLVTEIIFLFHEDLPARLLDRVIPWTLFLREMTDTKTKKIKPEWLEIAAKLEPGKAKSTLSDIARGIVGTSLQIGHVCVETPEDARLLARTLELSLPAQYSTMSLEKDLEYMREVLRQVPDLPLPTIDAFLAPGLACLERLQAYALNREAKMQDWLKSYGRPTEENRAA